MQQLEDNNLSLLEDDTQAQNTRCLQMAGTGSNEYELEQECCCNTLESQCIKCKQNNKSHSIKCMQTGVSDNEYERTQECCCNQSVTHPQCTECSQNIEDSANEYELEQETFCNKLGTQPPSIEEMHKTKIRVNQHKSLEDGHFQHKEVQTGRNIKVTKDILTPKVIAVLDKSRTSSSNAAFLIAALLEAIDLNAEDYQISMLDIHNKRQIIRQNKFDKIKEEFGTQKLSNVIVHWDVNMLLDITGDRKVDRLPIVITYNSIPKLLSVPKLENGTGKVQADVIYNALHEWGVSDYVVGLCCETTSFNLGNRNGAAVLLEHLLEKDLLYFPCRHHILELILRAVFKKLIPTTVGPTVPMFQRFRQVWSNIDKTNLESGLSDSDVMAIFENELEEIESHIRRNLTLHSKRDDYKELLCLSLMFLGIKPQENYQIKKPEAIHHTQWLSKAIYSLKIFLFRKGFLISKYNTLALRQICIFIVKIYIKYWFVADQTVKAANNDLNLIKDCYNFRVISESISQTALHIVINHLWYLNPENVAMAFYDVDVPASDKRKMVSRMLVKDSKDEEEGYDNKKVLIQISQVPLICEQGIEQFISPKSLNFFTKLSLNIDWINEDPEKWEHKPEYNKGRDIVKSIKVVNDRSEKNIKLFENYNGQIEDQVEFIALLLEAYQLKFQLNGDKDVTKS